MKKTLLNNGTVSNLATKYFETKLSVYADKMVKGAFINAHNDKEERCIAIVLLLSGEVCPIMRNTTQCMNPLRISDKRVHLSTFSLCAPEFVSGPDIEQSIEVYNKDVEKSAEIIKSVARSTIVAYHMF